MSEIDDLIALDLEYRLTIAHRISCSCATYFVDRRDVLIPEIMKQAEKEKDDPIDVFARFARKVHARHADQPSAYGLASRFAFLMGAFEGEGSQDLQGL